MRAMLKRLRLLAGMARSTCGSGESLLQRAIVGMLTYELSRIGWWSEIGSVRIRRRGSRKFFWTWLVKVPGVKRPAMATAPVC
mgnify:CR=1 FL=1